MNENVKKITSSNINQATVVIGALTLYRICNGIWNGEAIDISEYDAMNIVTFLGVCVIFVKRNWTEVKPTLKKVADRMQ